MFCTNCGAQLNEEAKFCSSCGTGLGEATVSKEEAQALEDQAVLREDQVKLIYEGFWGVPAKRGAIVCLEEAIILKPRGYDIFLASPIGYFVNRSLKKDDAKLNLYDVENQVYYIKDVERISILHRKLMRSKISIWLKDKDEGIEFYTQKVPERFEKLYQDLIEYEK